MCSVTAESQVSLCGKGMLRQLNHKYTLHDNVNFAMHVSNDWNEVTS